MFLSQQLQGLMGAHSPYNCYALQFAGHSADEIPIVVQLDMKIAESFK